MMMIEVEKMHNKIIELNETIKELEKENNDVIEALIHRIQRLEKTNIGNGKCYLDGEYEYD